VGFDVIRIDLEGPLKLRGEGLIEVSPLVMSHSQIGIGLGETRIDGNRP